MPTSADAQRVRLHPLWRVCVDRHAYRCASARTYAATTVCTLPFRAGRSGGRNAQRLVDAQRVGIDVRGGAYRVTVTPYRCASAVRIARDHGMHPVPFGQGALRRAVCTTSGRAQRLGLTFVGARSARRHAVPPRQRKERMPATTVCTLYPSGRRRWRAECQRLADEQRWGDVRVGGPQRRRLRRTAAPAQRTYARDHGGTCNPSGVRRWRRTHTVGR